MDAFPEPLLMTRDAWAPQVDGLRAILSSWSGQGLVKALSELPTNFNLEIAWSEKDVLARASRILLYKLSANPDSSPLLSRLPKTLREWQDATPASIHSERWVSDKIKPGVNWPSTVSRFGWPPKAFSGRSRKRIVDERVISPATWTINALIKHFHLSRLDTSTDFAAFKQLHALKELLADESFKEFEVESTLPPSREELNGLQAEGRPWADLASIAQELIRFSRDPASIAQELLWPDNELAWRLFHLSVMGLALLGISDAGYSIKSLRPIGDWGNGPAYRAEKEGVSLDIWYEAGGLWKYLNKKSPYAELCSSFTTSPRPLGADIAIWSSTRHLFLMECKLYKGDKDSAARDGYLQAVTYSAEASRIASSVVSVAVLPNWQVKQPGWTQLPSGSVGIISETDTRNIIREFAYSH